MSEIAKATWRYPASVDRKRASEGGFPAFFKSCFEAYEATPYVDSPHVDTCTREIERAWGERYSDVIMNLPPGHSKSTMLSLFEVYVWAKKDPGHRWFFGSYSPDLGARETGKMIALIRDPGFQERWPELRLVDAKKKEVADPGTTILRTSAGGLRFSNTPRGPATGWHFDSHHYDDLLKAIDLGAPALKSVRGFLTGTMASRWRSSRRNRLLGMQRLHISDPCAVMQEQASLEGAAPLTRIVLPLEYDPKLPELLKLTPYEAALDHRSAYGELLAPSRFDARSVAILKGQIGALADREAQLQQNPHGARGKVWRAEWFREWTKLPARFDYIADFWDMSFDDEGIDPDFVAGQRWGLYGPDVYLIGRAPTLQRDFPSSIVAVNEFRQKRLAGGYLPTGIVIEKKANGAGILKMLKLKVAGLIPYEPHGSKVQRAAAASVFGESGNVWVHANDKDFVATCVAFPAITHDDEVDASSMAINYLQGRAPAFGKVAQKMTTEELFRKLGVT